MLYFANWKIALICAVCALGVLLSISGLGLLVYAIIEAQGITGKTPLPPP